VSVESLELVSRSSRETERLAEALATELRAGDVVLVAGEVGTGKTTFVRAACRALGVTDRVTSPSFTIGRTYSGRLPVSHVDLFRLETLEGEDPTLLSDYLRPEAVSFVEWPEAAALEVDPRRVALRVRLAHLDGDARGFWAQGRSHLLRQIEGLGAAGGR